MMNGYENLLFIQIEPTLKCNVISTFFQWEEIYIYIARRPYPMLAIP